MKIFKSIAFLALAGVPTLASARTIEMDVNGLVCAFCAQGISKTLKAFPASDGVFVSLEHRLVAVHLKDGQDIADADLRKAITNAGYKLVAVHRTEASLAEIKARVATQKGKPLPKQGHDHAHEHEGMQDMGHHD
jgi:mercuric ion binding protein